MKIFLSLSRPFALIVASTGLMLSFLLLSTLPASAHTILHKAGTTQKTITILVLDMSGSMATNDPQGLRCSAANAYIDLSGPGNFIGLVGLDHKNTDGTDPQTNFQQAEAWSDPVEMSTLSARQGLYATIKQKSNNCQPDNTTPTYDALNQALQMLQQKALPQGIPASVILLTDGAPAPNTGPQINAITTTLLPQFKNHKWPIDTVALGTNDTITDNTTPFHTFHDFLNNIAATTRGNFYDDANGVIKGQPSPFNITPFFIDIFAQRNHRTPNQDIPLTSSPNNRNFSVTNYTDSLDIIVVKDQPDAQVTLKDPFHNTVTAQAGVDVFSDPYYQIISIQQPQIGTWEVDVTGPGQFVMDSLKLSNVQLSEINLAQNGRVISQTAALALGQPFTFSTTITNQGQPIISNAFTLSASITYTGGLGQYISPLIALDDHATPGTYTGTITIPAGSPTGTYKINIAASSVSGAVVISSQERSPSIENFPAPVLFSPQTQQPVNDTINAQVVQWHPIFQVVYGLPLGFVDWLSHWPLQNLPARQTATVQGVIELNQRPYPNAQVTAQATLQGGKGSIPVQLTNDGKGHFHLQFLAQQSGLYTITFQTSGDVFDSHGDFGVTQRMVNVTLIPATIIQGGAATLISIFYLFVLFILGCTFRFFILPHPFGGWTRSLAGESTGVYNFKRARRGLRQWFFEPHLVYSRQAQMPRGLIFRFLHGGGIEVKADGRAGTDWQYGDGGTLRPSFQEVRELRYRPASEQNDEDGSEPATYLIQSQLKSKRGSTSSSSSYSRWSDDDEPAYKATKKRGGKKTKREVRDDTYDW